MRGNSNEDLVDHLQKIEALKTPSIINAFLNVDRKDFMGGRHKGLEYIDQPFEIGSGQTISQPYTVAFMLELLKPEPGHNVLDIGSGSGWTTALLSYIVGSEGKVTGLEIRDELAIKGRINLTKYNFENTTIENAGKDLGRP